MKRLMAAVGLLSGGLLLYELTLTRVFAVVLFSDLAHLALSVAMLGLGIGAMIQQVYQPIREDNLNRMVSGLTLGQALATVFAVFCALNFPLLEAGGTGLHDQAWLRRAAERFSAMRWGWFTALIPALSLPPILAGLTLSGVFEHRRQALGKLYGADLMGAAAAAVVFLPAVAWLRGPDAVWLSALCCAIAAAVIAPTGRPRTIAGVSGAASALAVGIALSGTGLLQIRAAAGWTNGTILETRWTALTRLSVLDEGEKDMILLDNATLSTVVEVPRHLNPIANMANRSLVYEIGVPKGRVAVLAASAGPDVATAIAHGFDEIDAIDIEGEIFALVAERYDGPLNPYRSDKVRQVVSDARSAMMRAPSNHYTIIQLVNANLF
ncbi:MAG: hypothetical protein AAFV53_29460, partial [Myxococcota bacterium]